MEEPAEKHTLVVGASDHHSECAVRAPANVVVAARGDSAAGRHGGGGAERERVHEKRTSGDWLCTWRPPRPFKLTRFRIQPTRKKRTDRVFLSSACEPLDPACEPLDQARLH